jgi:hypothetical protein
MLHAMLSRVEGSLKDGCEVVIQNMRNNHGSAGSNYPS